MQAKRIKRDITGVLLLDKPSGISSNHALQQVKHLYRAAKAGHTGNLDPIATGMLPLCLGEATKFSQFLLDADKTYRATVKLGETTTTGDIEGEVLTRSPVGSSDSDVRRALRRFEGVITQVPPMYSALKYQGKALYSYAREGIEVDRQPREVEIFHIALEQFEQDTFTMLVTCSKGTYIRVLAEDIGKLLGCGAHLTALRRTRVGRFDLADAYSIDELRAFPQQELDALLIQADALVTGFPRIDLDADAAYYVSQGNPVWQSRVTARGKVRIYDDAGFFLGVGEIDHEGRVAPKRLMVSRQKGLSAADGAEIS